MTLKVGKEHSFIKHFKKYVLSKQQKESAKEAMLDINNCIDLPKKFDDHQLSHQKKGVRDFHISSDLVVIYYLTKNVKVSYIDVGPHAKVFNPKKKRFIN